MTFKQPWLYGFSLFFLLVSLYFLTFKGFPLSQDEFFIYDSTESLVHRGDFYRTYEFSRFNEWEVEVEASPWGPPLQEPLVTIALMPFFWLGSNLDSVGTMHVVWLFNIFVTAATALSLFYGAWLLGASPHHAWLLAVLFGLSTVAWPYTRHLFREPLMTFFLLWCFIFALRIHQQERASWRLWMGLAFSFACAFLTKAASLVALPALIILLVPSITISSIPKRWRLWLFVAFILAAVAVIGLGSVNNRYSLAYWANEIQRIQLSFIVESLLGYHLSFSRSIWLHSPVLFIGLIGCWSFIRARNWRYVFSPLLLIILLSASYGIAHEDSWWGSWGWGPRYMLPLTPVLLLIWVLPMLRHLDKRLYQAGFGLAFAAGFLLQVLGMAVSLNNYYTVLNWEGLLTDWALQGQWEAYNWTWHWSPLRYHLTAFEMDNMDFAWRVADGAVPALVLSAAVAFVSLGVAVWLFRGRSLPRFAAYLLVIVMVGTMASSIAIGVYALRDDPRYIEGYDDVLALSRQLDAQVEDDTVIFVDRDLYMPVFMNYFKSPAIVANLPYAPAENYGDGPQVVTDDLSQQIGYGTYYAITWSAMHHDDIWLMTSSTPFDTTKIRPIERFMAMTYFPMSEMQTSDRARAVRFSTRSTAYQTGSFAEFDLAFGDGLQLLGINLPSGTDYHAGEVIPVSLAWSVDAPLPEDYNVGVHIATLDGFILSQRDGQPQGTFGKMSQWQAGEIYLDNHGLQLPPDIPPGEYVIQVVVYRWQDGQRLIWDDGDATGDVARLMTITIN